MGAAAAIQNTILYNNINIYTCNANLGARHTLYVKQHAHIYSAYISGQLTRGQVEAHRLDFKGFDSIGILILRGGFLMSTGDVPENMSQQISAGIILV